MKLFPLTRITRKVRLYKRQLRQAQVFAKAMKSPRHPILAHLVVTRRCNLSCAYCNEFDKVSNPVPAAAMLRRVDLLAALGTSAITLSGGEPLLHPDLDDIIRRIRSHGILAGVLTNGYLLTAERIRRLNRAGLDYLQISVDNVTPDEVSMKSLKVLDKKLQVMAALAEFNVNINSVLGGGIHNPEDALTITRRVQELGFTGTVGIIHDHSGQLQPLNEQQRGVYKEIVGLSKKSFNTFAYYNQFQKNLLNGLPNDWQCRAGSRYLYVCEDGLVHYCSQQRGYPGIPLEQYTRANLEREYHTKKPCAPLCTISCVHQVSMIDAFRENPLAALARTFPPPAEEDSPVRMPFGVRVLTGLLLPANPGRARRKITRAFRRVALRLLRVS
ncbi:MAG TPA: radical SAM protein [Blastocatellia bacterium]|nr:radical SAM protein [Blastocatellia bacterium]